ncbi:MAG: class I SAM-dependent methyltransferase [Candidatus Thorarchaeota archaeon]|jgi:2-polyprenyl-3-methyl-5-hydroxy-6-metoxy-1,4-benzoquinol methylase
MREEPIDLVDVISIIKKMASESNLRMEELEGFLDRYGSQYGSLILLRNLAEVDFRLKETKDALEYAFSKSLAIQFVEDRFGIGENVLSIGCSIGLLESNLARQGYNVWGIDKKGSAIEIARRLAQEAGLSSRCEFVPVDSYEYHFQDEFFDTVLYSHSLHEIDDKKASLNESHRVLKPQGHVIVLEDGTTREDVVASISESEFTIKKEMEAFPGVYHGQPTPVILIELEKNP